MFSFPFGGNGYGHHWDQQRCACGDPYCRGHSQREIAQIRRLQEERRAREQLRRQQLEEQAMQEQLLRQQALKKKQEAARSRRILIQEEKKKRLALWNSAAEVIQAAWRAHKQRKNKQLQHELLQKQSDAAFTIAAFLRHAATWTRMSKVLSALKQLRAIENDIEKARSEFLAAPGHTYFQVLGYQDAIEKICLRADEVLSGGNELIRRRRKAVVKAAHEALKIGDLFRSRQEKAASTIQASFRRHTEEKNVVKTKEQEERAAIQREAAAQKLQTFFKDIPRIKEAKNAAYRLRALKSHNEVVAEKKIAFEQARKEFEDALNNGISILSANPTPMDVELDTRTSWEEELSSLRAAALITDDSAARNKRCAVSQPDLVKQVSSSESSKRRKNKKKAKKLKTKKV